MYYEVLSKRIGQDAKGNDREYSERFLVENAVICAAAEQKVLALWNGQNDVVSIKQSKIREFVNKRKDDDQYIFLATIEDIFIDENSGEEKTTKYIVGLFANSVEEATKITAEYMRQGINDMMLTSIKKTKIVDLL